MLAHGVTYIEGDLSRMFPAATTPTASVLTSAVDTVPTAAPPGTPTVLYAVPIPPAPADAPPSTTAIGNELPGTTATTDAPFPAPAQPADTQPTPTVSMAEPPTATLPDVQPEPAPLRADPPALVTAKVVAAALGYRDAGAFHSFVFRHKELKRYSRKAGLSVLWDLGKLRAEYERKGWQLRRTRQPATRLR